MWSGTMDDYTFTSDRDFLLRDGDLCVRPVCDRTQDYVILSGWLQNPRVLEFFGGRDQHHSLEAIREKYAPKQPDQSDLFPCLIEFLDRPVGFIQFDQLRPEELSRFGYSPQEIVYRVDLFIGETDLWGYGLGRRALRIVTRHLFQARSASQVVSNPQVDNPRAVRSYLAAGFRNVKLLPRHQLHEGQLRDCYLMEADNDQRI